MRVIAVGVGVGIDNLFFLTSVQKVEWQSIPNKPYLLICMCIRVCVRSY